MKVGSLFSGIGGFDLGLERAGFTIEWQSEIEPYCCEVLKKHWPEVPNLGDIFGIKDPPAVDLICGGFPCQPFSVAGKRQGKADDRYLWPEMLRVITEVKPRWVFAENVPGIIHMELDQVLSDLEGQGYETGTLIIPACAVNAPHRRNRIWIVANQFCRRSHSTIPASRIHECSIGQSIAKNNGRSQEDRYAPDTDRKRLKEPWGTKSIRTSHGEPERSLWTEDWSEVATRLCRVDDGLPAWVHRHRVARLKALGNAIVPQIAEEIGRMIMAVDLGLHVGTR